MAKRNEILQDTKAVREGQNRGYDEAGENLSMVSKLWNAYLGDNVTDTHDVAMMMALVGIARIRAGRREEAAYTEACEYISCGGEIGAHIDQ